MILWSFLVIFTVVLLVVIVEAWDASRKLQERSENRRSAFRFERREGERS